MKKTIQAVVSRYNYFWMTLFFIFIVTNSIGQKKISEPDINSIFFKNTEFSKPFYLDIPAESDLSEYQRNSQNTDSYVTDATEGVTISSVDVRLDKQLPDWDSYLIGFLSNSGFARILCTMHTTHHTVKSDKVDFNYYIFYNDILKRLINGGNSVKIGHRELLSIDYKNQYEDSPNGMKRTFYSITFSYKLVSDLKDVNNIDGIYTGKGKMFLDPDDGTWKLNGPFDNLGLKLSDQKGKEFLQIIRNQSSRFDFERCRNILVQAENNRQDSIRIAKAIQDSIDFKKKTLQDSIDYKKKYPNEIKYSDGSYYRGTLNDGKRNLYGEITYADGSSYSGDWKDDKKEGKGEMNFSDGRYYEGMFTNDIINGTGRMNYKDGSYYEGNFNNGMRDYGVYFSATNGSHGSTYHGQFKNDKPDGVGEFSYKYDWLEGEVLTVVMNGVFKNGDLFDGIITQTSKKNGAIYTTLVIKGKQGNQTKN